MFARSDHDHRLDGAIVTGSEPGGTVRSWFGGDGTIKTAPEFRGDAFVHLVTDSARRMHLDEFAGSSAGAQLR
jgi:hypothetical protein